jgi:hypothetical protein
MDINVHCMSLEGIIPSGTTIVMIIINNPITLGLTPYWSNSESVSSEIIIPR